MDKNTLLADWFYESMVGLGTRDRALMQLVLGRSELRLVLRLLVDSRHYLTITAILV